MNRYLAITDVYAREILDSRGNPTIEVEVLAGDEFLGRAAVPSGASTGQYEAVELRDREERYGGLGVQRAVDHVNTKLAQAVIGLNVFDQAHLDQVLLKTDGTQNKSNMGANALLGFRWLLREQRQKRCVFRFMPILEESMRKKCRFR